MSDITRDSSSSLGDDFAGNTTDKNFSFTLTTAGLVLFGIADQSGLASSIFTGVDWNGVAMTLLGTQTAGSSADFIRVYGIYTTATGTHNFTVHKSGNAVYSAAAASYKDTATTTVDAASVVALKSQNSSVQHNLDGVIVPTVDRSFIAAFAWHIADSIAAGASPTSQFVAGSGFGWFDSNVVGVITPAASTTIETTASSFPNAAMVLVAIAPPGGGGGGGTNWGPMLAQQLNRVVQ